jgi:hypothetical protein
MYTNPFSAFANIVKTEGAGALYKGIGIVVFSAAPAQALYFSGMESFKKLAGAESIAISFAAGVNAQLWASFIW